MAIDIRTSVEARPLWPALAKGMACKCPKCGEGKLFRAYLKTADECSNCGEVFSHHRADDLPPYIAIFIVGHIIIAAMLHIEMIMTVNPMTYMVVLVPLSIVMPLALLPSIKGAVVALQWSMRMHGFDPENTQEH